MDSDNSVRRGGSFAVFALPSFPGNSPPEADIDENGNRVRRRRKHIKSRTGCASCKERKIKCDEDRPSCKNCINRQFTCSYAALDSPSGSQSSLQIGLESVPNAGEEVRPPAGQVSGQQWPSNVQLPLEGMDMQPMELLHQFETFTSETMMFGAEMWRMRVIPLALKNDFLMHAILLIACSHLRYLHPDEPAYRRLEAQHLSLAITDFRRHLGEPISEDNIDVLAACGLTLLHHAWSDTDSLEEMDIGAYNIFALSIGPRSVVERILQMRFPSVFLDIVSPDYERLLIDWISKFHSRYEFEEYFTLLSREDPNYIHTDTIQTLIPILRVYELHISGVDLSNKDVDYFVSRYIFNWPAKCSSSFRAHVDAKEPEALLILLCFYTITPRLLSSAWWVRSRSEFMQQAICRMFETQSRELKGRLERIRRFFHGSRT